MGSLSGTYERSRRESQRAIVPLKQIEYGVYGDLIAIYPKGIFYLLKGGYKGLRSNPKEESREPCMSASV